MRDELDIASTDPGWMPPPGAPWTPRTTAERLNEEARARSTAPSAPSAPTIDHASYLGASDIGAILGLDPMRTPLDVWAEKTRRVAFETTDEIEAGNDHEAGVIAGAERRLRRMNIASRVEYPGPGTIVVQDGALTRGATLDAVVHHNEAWECPLEAKLVGSAMSGAWGPEPAAENAIPQRTFVQVHWQALHARERFGWTCPLAFVAADIGGTDRRLYTIAIDDEVIASLLAAAREWWRRHIIGGEIPEPTSRDNALLGRIYPHADRPLSPIAPNEVRELAEQYAVAREIAGRHRDELDRIAAKLRALLGDAEGYRWPGGKVTWREAEDGTRRLYVRIREAA